MRSVIVLHLDETETYQLPADAAGNMAPFAAFTGLTRPSAATGIIGGAREWTGSGQGLAALESVADSTALRRDCTIEVVCDLPWLTTDGTYRLITRGTGASSAERELWGLQVVVTGAPSAPVVQLQMRWQRAGGSSATVPAVTFDPPSGWLYLAASRRWVSETEVEVAYYCNGSHLGTVTSAHGDIADGVGGTVLLGCDATPAGLPTGSLIDEVRVSNDVRSLEEIEWTHRAMFVLGQQGYELMRALLPPGEAYSTDPDSAIQRELMVTGDGLGVAWARAEQISRHLLPDRAWSFLDQWERVTRLAPLPTDSIALRRARVTSFLRRVQGYTWDQVSELVAEFLDCEATDLELREYGHTTDETFASDTGLWLREAGDGTSTTIAAGVATFTAAASDDLVWTGLDDSAMRIRSNLLEEERADLIASITPTTLPANCAVGIYCWSKTGNAFEFFGIINDGGTKKWFRRLAASDGSVADTIGDAIPAGTVYWLRWIEQGDGTVDLQYRVDGSGFDGPWTEVWAAVATGARQWCGVACLSTAVLAGALSVTVGDFRVRCPMWGGVFHWYVYRDTALGGAPDFKSALLAIEKVKPAHTLGTICEDLSLECDSATSLCDRDPLGV